MQRTQQFEPKPPVASLDFSDHLRMAYFNAENALGMFQAVSMEGTYVSMVAKDKFVGCVQIVVAMLLGTPKLSTDTAFKKAIAPKILANKSSASGTLYSNPEPKPESKEPDSFEEALEIFTAVTQLFHDKGIFKETESRYGGHL